MGLLEVLLGIGIVSFISIGIWSLVLKRERDQAIQYAEDAWDFRSKFLANMSHDIRTPIYGISGPADLLARTDLSFAQRAHLDTIQTSLDSLLKLVNDLLPAPAVIEEVKATSKDVRKANILVAEDNPINQMITLKMLEQMGHSVDRANNGKEVLTAVQEKHYDLIVMDVQMPELDGIETTKIIRRNLNSRINKVPILAMTASALKEDEARCLQVGMDAYISKPTKLFLFEQIVSSCLSSHRENDKHKINHAR